MTPTAGRPTMGVRADEGLRARYIYATPAKVKPLHDSDNTGSDGECVVPIMKRKRDAFARRGPHCEAS